MGPTTSRSRNVPTPEPKGDEVLCRVKAVAICGTDPKIVAGKFPGFWPPTFPGGHRPRVGRRGRGRLRRAQGVREGRRQVRPRHARGGRGAQGLRLLPQLHDRPLHGVPQLRRQRRRPPPLRLHLAGRLRRVHRHVHQVGDAAAREPHLPPGLHARLRRRRAARRAARSRHHRRLRAGHRPRRRRSVLLPVLAGVGRQRTSS